MTRTREYTISDIEAMTEADAAELALEKLDIKGHTVYLVDFGGYFGYSCLVFKNGHHIRYANDYQLHHPGLKLGAGLRTWYIEEMNNKLFTEDEIAAPLKDYREYDCQFRYLRDFYGQSADHLSIFGDFSTEAKVKAYEEKKKAYPYYSNIAFGWYADREFVEHLDELFNKLEAAKDAARDDFDYWKGAFKYEMGNHEYHINWQADYDTLSIFGNVRYHGDEENEVEQYFNELQFTDVQRRAYWAARKEYFEGLRDY